MPDDMVIMKGMYFVDYLFLRFIGKFPSRVPIHRLFSDVFGLGLKLHAHRCF